MKEILQQLANLQYIDSRIDEIKQLRGDLPEEILDIETDIARNEHKFTRLNEEEKALIVEYDNLKLEITSSEQKIKKYEDQQLIVRNNREYDALTKEIEVQKRIIENSLARIVEIEKRQESIGTEIEEAKKKLAEVTTLFKAKKNSLEQVMKSTEEEEQILVNKRTEVEKEVDNRYIKNYKRLRNGLQNGIAVVAMDRGAALGMVLPPQTQVEVRRMNKIITDENSGRIVIDQSFFENAKKTLSI